MTAAQATARGERAPQRTSTGHAPHGVFIELPEMGTCFYRQYLNPGKPTLLLLHGMVASSGLNWFRLLPALQPYFNIIAPDVRGHGRSWPGKGRFSFAAAADDAAALIDVLELGPVIAVGYSMGGAIAQYLCHRHPEKVAGLVLAASNYRARIARREELVVLPLFAAMIGVGHFTEIFGHLPKGLLKRFLPKLADQLHDDETRWALDEMRRTRIRSVIETGREMMLHDAADWLHEINVPTAVVVMEKDRAVPPQHQYEMAERIRGAELFCYDDGHVACMATEFGPVLAQACASVANRVSGAALP